MNYQQLSLFERVEQEGRSTQETDLERRTSRQYRIPGRTENPTVNAEMMRSWIREFCQLNNIGLPKYLHRKNKAQLMGCFFGFLDFYRIAIEDIVPNRQY